MKAADGRAWARITRFLELPAQGPWIQQAACAGDNPDHWYLAENRGGNFGYARTICAGCPVRRDCLDWAIRAGEDQGLWGGLSPSQRRDHARKRAS